MKTSKKSRISFKSVVNPIFKFQARSSVIVNDTGGPCSSENDDVIVNGGRSAVNQRAEASGWSGEKKIMEEGAKRGLKDEVEGSFR